MEITSTERARAIVERAKAARSGALTITLGTGCCESTAPFLYEDFWPGPDQEVVGEVAGVPVYAPGYLRSMYPDGDGMVIDVVEDTPAESMSIETEWNARLILRGTDLREPAACAAEPSVTSSTVATGGPSRVRGELPAALRNLRVR